MQSNLKEGENDEVVILIVDDAMIIRDLFNAILHLEGCVTIMAEDGQKAVEIAQKKKIDLAFIDIRLPGENGLEVFRKLRAIDPEISCIMMTGYADEDIIEQSLKEGAVKCLEKPFDINKIKEILLVMVKRKREKGHIK